MTHSMLLGKAFVPSVVLLLCLSTVSCFSDVGVRPPRSQRSLLQGFNGDGVRRRIYYWDLLFQNPLGAPEVPESECSQCSTPDPANCCDVITEPCCGLNICCSGGCMAFACTAPGAAR